MGPVLVDIGFPMVRPNSVDDVQNSGDSTLLARVIAGQREDTNCQLRLRGEVHALEEGLESGVGTERIEERYCGLRTERARGPRRSQPYDLTADS